MEKELKYYETRKLAENARGENEFIWFVLNKGYLVIKRGELNLIKRGGRLKHKMKTKKQMNGYTLAKTLLINLLLTLSVISCVLVLGFFLEVLGAFASAVVLYTEYMNVEKALLIIGIGLLAVASVFKLLVKLTFYFFKKWKTHYRRLRAKKNREYEEEEDK